MYAYKLAQRTSVGYSSLTCYGKVTWYEKGQWTEAPFGGLICFKTYRDMLDFMPGPNVGWARLLVEVEDEVELPEYRSVGTAADARAAWDKDLIQSIDCRWQKGWPKGTVAFKRVRIIQEVGHDPD